MRKLKDLNWDECIFIQTKHQAKKISKSLSISTDNVGRLVGKYICVDKINNIFSWTDIDGIGNRTMLSASDFIKPKKSKLKQLRKDVDYLKDFVANMDRTIIVSGDIDIVKFPIKLEKGKWYKNLRNCLFNFNGEFDITEEPRGVGFDEQGRWRDVEEWGWGMSGLIVAGIQEVEKALIAEANSRGFEEGVVFKRLSGEDTAKCRGKIYWHENDGCPGLFCDGHAIMQKGIWAEIISKPENIDYKGIYEQCLEVIEHSLSAINFAGENKESVRSIKKESYDRLKDIIQNN